MVVLSSFNNNSTRYAANLQTPKTPDSVITLACVKRQRSDHGIARRANALLLLDDGESCVRVAKVLYLDDDTIRNWFKQYQSEGWDGVADDGWKGGQSRMTAV